MQEDIDFIKSKHLFIKYVSIFEYLIGVTTFIHKRICFLWFEKINKNNLMNLIIRTCGYLFVQSEFQLIVKTSHI
jgi:hypothetical protein